MRSSFLLVRIFVVLTMAVIFAGSSFAQGKGHGGGKRHEGASPGQQKHGDGNRGGDSGDGEKRERRGGSDRWEGQGQSKHEPRQMDRGGRQNQQREVRQVERQQPQQWRHAPRQEAQDGHRQQRDQWQNTQRQQQRVYAQPQQNWGQFRREQNFEAKQYRNESKARRHDDRDAWKYARKQQHFEDKSRRKAERRYQGSVSPYAYRQRDAWVNNDLYQPRYRDDRSYDRTNRDRRSYQPTYQDYRSYAPTYPQYYQPEDRSDDYPRVYSQYPGNYDDSGYYGDQTSSWVQPLIRSVIASFFSSGTDDGYDNDAAYGQEQYYGNGDNYGYAPQFTYSQPTYYSFGYPAASSNYEPTAYYGYDQYADNEIPYDAFQGSMPYNDVHTIYSGGLAGEMIQRALGTGYYQGLLEGQAAHQRGWGDQYYSDPYLYEQAIYDPYSSSIGDNRRYFSEGYEMGYQDALRGRDEFNIEDGGNVDLVSLLMGSVLSLRG